MSKLTSKELSVHVLKFLEHAAPLLATVVVTDGDSDQIDDNGTLIPTYLTVNETLAHWVQLPDGAYSYMFIGWLLAEGIALPDGGTLAKAVCYSLTGNESNVMFDWYGDANGTNKPN